MAVQTANQITALTTVNYLQRQQLLKMVHQIGDPDRVRNRIDNSPSRVGTTTGTEFDKVSNLHRTKQQQF